MYVKDLWLSQYRSYEELRIGLKPGTIIFLGPNGVGKTNIVEAIAYSGNLYSHRTSSDVPLVRHGKKQAGIKIKPVRGKLQLIVDIRINTDTRNSARINRGPEISPKKVSGIVKTVVFGPEDLNLIRGDPQGRRIFFDRFLALLHPIYSKLKSDAEKILRQRNAVLKTMERRLPSCVRSEKKSLADTLSAWNEQFIENSSRISWYRAQIVGEMNRLIGKLYGYLSEDDKKAEILYNPSIMEYFAGIDSKPGPETKIKDFEERYRKAVLDFRDAEIERGISLIGPQRDDVLINLGGYSAKSYASHGESWSLVLSLKLASYNIITNGGSEGNDDPIVILDDVFAELDNKRREKLASMIGHVEQLLITAAVPEDVPDALKKTRNVTLVDVSPGSAVVREY